MPASGPVAINGCPRMRCGLRRAFSLIELIVVLAIIGIMSAMAVPRFAGPIMHRRAQGAALHVAADLNYARQRAAHTSASQTVTFNLSTNSYELAGVQSLDRVSGPYVVSLSAEPYGAAIVRADFGGDAEVVFDLYERPDSGGQVVVAVGSWQNTVTLDADTGETTVSE